MVRHNTDTENLGNNEGTEGINTIVMVRYNTDTENLGNMRELKGINSHGEI